MNREENMRIVNVFHGSDHIIRKPKYLGGKDDNDYGNGFYTTEYEKRAKSWAALNGQAFMRLHLRTVISRKTSWQGVR